MNGFDTGGLTWTSATPKTGELGLVWPRAPLFRRASSPIAANTRSIFHLRGRREPQIVFAIIAFKFPKTRSLRAGSCRAGPRRKPCFAGTSVLMPAALYGVARVCHFAVTSFSDI